jgi:hypothetical protein
MSRVSFYFYEHAEVRRCKSKNYWNLEIGPNSFIQEGEHEPLCVRTAPQTAFGFKKGNPFSQTRWRF